MLEAVDYLTYFMSLKERSTAAVDTEWLRRAEGKVIYFASNLRNNGQVLSTINHLFSKMTNLKA